MAKVSVVIPTRNEMFLSKTVDDLFAKATGDLEVVVSLDGYLPDPPLKERPNLVINHIPESKGMRHAINSGVEIATGKYIFKLDGHCMLGEGFDEILQADCEDDWVVVPRRVSLEPENWTIQDNGKAPVDYHYLSFPPLNKSGLFTMHGEVWRDRAKERLNIPIDDEMSSQGSGWFMMKSYFDRFGGMPEEGYGKFAQEFQQIGCRAWLSGGRVIVNKKTWYAHLHKGKTYGRGYYLSKREMVAGQLWAAKYWIGDHWKERKYDFEWMIDKFWPVPGWPADWKTREYPVSLP
jgi:glycosyltransferase involved in cell wall biosynthesis